MCHTRLIESRRGRSGRGGGDERASDATHNHRAGDGRASCSETGREKGKVEGKEESDVSCNLQV